jgi:GTP cyclohydrolase II
MNPIVRAAIGEALKGAMRDGGQVLQAAMQHAASEGLGMVIVIRKNDTGEVMQFSAGLSPTTAFEALKIAAREIRLQAEKKRRGS